MSAELVQTRNTPQQRAVLEALEILRHATNLELLRAVRPHFPELTVTSIHRMTKRLIAAGRLGRGPAVDGVVLIDANPEPHDHFWCTGCNAIRDLTISEAVYGELQRETGQDVVRRGLVIMGLCKPCQ